MHKNTKTSNNPLNLQYNTVCKYKERNLSPDNLGRKTDDDMQSLNMDWEKLQHNWYEIIKIQSRAIQYTQRETLKEMGKNINVGIVNNDILTLGYPGSMASIYNSKFVLCENNHI